MLDTWRGVKGGWPLPSGCILLVRQLTPKDRLLEMWADSGVWRSSFGSVLISPHVILGTSLLSASVFYWHINDTLVYQVLYETEGKK